MTEEAGTLTKRVLRMRSANEWMRGADDKPAPALLFGEYWLEGELAVMFADTGQGKSVLGVQIAESIAAGQAIEPVKMTAAAQTVLYFDFELSERQFQMRYTRDELETVDGKITAGRYEFSDRFKRIDLDLVAAGNGSRRSGDNLIDEIEDLVRSTQARVVIIDNITFLRDRYENAAYSIILMNRLRRLKAEYGLSILVLAHTSKRRLSGPLSAGDLQGSKAIANFADNIFAIGQSRTDPELRYIKHVKQRSTECTFDAQGLPTFRLSKMGENFLGFCFQGLRSEAALLSFVHESPDWPVIDRIKKLTDDGLTIRTIAAELGMSKTRAHRLLKMWEPPAQTTAHDAEPESQPANFHFPGREQFEAAKADPRFKKMFGAGDDEDWALRREYGIIESACARARKQYLKNGTFTPLADDPKYIEFLTNGHIERVEGSEGANQAENAAGDPESDDRWSGSQPSPFAGLKHALDPNGRLIYVEKEDARGKPVVWYLPRKDGKFTHKERDTYGPNNTTVDGPLCLFDMKPHMQPRD